jgi:type IV fimbrial biogenesis protein FimT
MSLKIQVTYQAMIKINKGFSLMELLIVLAVLAILLAIAAPSFDAMIKNNRLSAQTNEFILSLMRARSEAMNRIQRVTVCPSATGTSCAGTGGWEQGWLVFTELHDSQNATVDSGDNILMVKQTLSGNNTLRGNTSVASYVSFVGTGFTQLTNGNAQTGTLVLCDDRGFASGKAVILYAAGRPRVVQASASSAISCTP